MDNKPLISIIMGIYNCEKTLSESIESIINQTYENWELIMCDDCSDDSTLKIAQEFEKKYQNKIKVIKNEENITLGPTLNKCLKLVRGKYVARQDGDDISNLNRLKEEVEFLENNKEYDLVATGMTSFDENGEKGIHQLKAEPTKKDFLLKGSTFCHATIMIKTEVFKQLNGYSEEWFAKQAEDYELWSRFFNKGFKGYNLQKSLYYVREDMDAYKRRNARRRIRGVVLNSKIYPKLKAPIYCYINILKDIIAIFIPTKVFSYYYMLKLR